MIHHLSVALDPGPQLGRHGLDPHDVKLEQAWRLVRHVGGELVLRTQIPHAVEREIEVAHRMVVAARTGAVQHTFSGSHSRTALEMALWMERGSSTGSSSYPPETTVRGRPRVRAAAP